MSETQQETVDFLTARLGATKRIVTHISTVLLGETRVYKLKRAVRLPYLDFSTPELRLGLCEKEVELNRRFAPSLYLGVRRVTRAADGALTLDGDGEFVDAIVEMRRFPDDALFDDMAREGRLATEMVESLAQRVAQTHDRATPDFSRGGAAAMARIIDSMEESLRQAAPAPMPDIEAHIGSLREALAAHAATIDARRGAGKVRPCHGDLNLRNICLFDGAATPFDCIEFSDDISTIDVLYDLAFLLMDLWRVGLTDFANLTLNRYLDSRVESEDEGLRLLPFFMSLRATIRAHVEASQGHEATARAFFDLSRGLLAPSHGEVVAIGGFSGAGKSSVAGMLAPRLAPGPGARVFNSDRIRKKLFNVAPNARLPAAAYASEVSARVYDELFESAARVAQAGWPVVVDAVFDRPADREAIEKAAGDAPFLGVWLDVDLAQRLARVDARVNDVSDATRDVLVAQMQKETGEMTWRRVDAARNVDVIAADVIAAAPPPHPSPASRERE